MPPTTEAGSASAGNAPVEAQPLLAALTTLLPDRPRTLLLRAALLGGSDRDDAWASMERERVDIPELFRRDTVGLKRLGPALYLASRESQLTLPREWSAVLRTAYAREEMRAAEYAKILQGALVALASSAVDHVLLTGAALGHTAYPQSALRHAHDIDLLIRPGSESAVQQALEPAGFSSPRSTPLSGGTVTGLVHDSLLPLLLHEHFFRVPGLGPEADHVWDMSVPATVLEQRTRVLSRELALLRVFARAVLCPHRAGGQWVADAWHLLRPPGFDWAEFATQARAGHLAAPATVFLGYLSQEMTLTVPQDVTSSLESAAAATNPFVRDVLLFGTRHHAPGLGPLRTLEVTSSAGRKLRRAHLFPSGDYLRWSFGTDRGSWPVLWVRRLIRSGLRR